MDIKEIQNKTAGELNNLLFEARKKLDDLRFKANQKQLKNVREVRNARKTVARILMVLKKTAGQK